MIKYLKKYWLFALLAPIFMIGEVSMDLLQPRLMSKIVDEGVLGLSNNNIGNLDLILRVGMWMILAVIAGGIFGILSGVFANLCSQNFGNDIRKDCFRRIMELSFQQTDEFSTGSLVTRVTNDVTQVQNMVAQLIRGCVRSTMFFIGGIYCMMSMSIPFGIAVLCTLPIVGFSILYFVIKANPHFMVLQKKLDRVNSVMQENVAGMRVVKAYVREKYEQDRFQKANDELVNTQLRVLKIFAFMTPITNIILNITIVIVIKIGDIQVQAGALSPGNVMAAITYVSQIMNGVMMIAMLFQTISRGKASSVRLNELLNCVPIITDGEKMQQNKEGKEKKVSGKIEFRNVSFSYPDNQQESILQDVNLVIQPGEMIGILGGTGCGKSTLVNLIPRFYDPTKGQILIDDEDIKNYSLRDLREKISIALQKSELFSVSIKENILWGKDDAREEEIKIAADSAQATEFISQKSEGYDTLVAERGMSLSGGQKQRLAITRALLKDSEILILDDATSALDLKTEAKLMQALRERYANTTKILIAQRIASVMNADRIAILENGRIVDCDTHENLLKNSRIYQEIYHSQITRTKKGGEANE